eukprot:TRINITY_DN3886_c0_g1_i1.p1 TRINITY_DN3886_c0_g1~~TRINITY_DN3886_c0_g1_i1.p1  ORF type:complete len:152 (-),score=16.00 TRINITY_DN3886_c0_g1_i1:453-908(-)
MRRRPPRSPLSSSSAASDVYKRQYQRRVRGLLTDPTPQMARAWNNTDNAKIYAETVARENQISGHHPANKGGVFFAPSKKPQPQKDDKGNIINDYEGMDWSGKPSYTPQVPSPAAALDGLQVKPCAAHGISKCNHCYRAPWLAKTQPTPLF